MAKPDKTRQVLSIEQESAVEFLLQGRSDLAVAESVGMSRQTIWEWRNRNPVFIAELNKRRSEMWREARERLKSLAGRGLDVIETQLGSDDPKAALAAAKYVLAGNRLMGETDLPTGGLKNPRAVLFARLKKEAQSELMAETDALDLNMFRIDKEADSLARSRLAKAIEEAGL